MAVNITTAQFFDAVRILPADARTELTGEAERHMAAATARVLKYAPDAPDAVHNEAALLYAALLFDQDTAPRGLGYGRGFRACGAEKLLQPWRKRRAASVAKSTNGSS